MARTTKALTKRRSGPRAQTLPLGGAHALEVVAGVGCARVRVLSSGQDAGLELEIVITERGPTLRVRAAALEFETPGDVGVRCRRFAVEASESVTLTAGAEARVEADAVTLEARKGMAKIRANDDVQLMGEQVLLNCERQAPMPSWVQTLDAPALLPTGPSCGDASLLAALVGDGSTTR